MSVSTTAADQAVCAPLPVLGRDVTVPLVTGGEVTYAALDYAASAPALQRVWDDVAAYAPYLTGSVHRGAGYLSQLSTDLFENARRTVAEFLDRRGLRPGRLHPLHDRLPQPARRHPPGRLPGVRLRDGTPRLAAAVEGRPGHLPRRAPHPAGGRHGSGAGPRRPRPPRPGSSSASPGPRTSPASCGRCASWPPPRTRTVPGSSWTPPSSPRTTRCPCGTSTSTGSPSPGTSCTRRSVPACSRAAPTGCARPSRISRAAAPAGKVTRRVDGGVDVEWHESAARHEAGSPNVIGAYSIASACKALTEAGFDTLVAREEQLIGAVRAGLAEAPEVRVLSLFGDDAPRVGVISFVVEGWNSSHFAAALSAEYGSGGMVSARTRWCGRCSAAIRRRRGRARGAQAAPGEKSLNAIRVSFGAWYARRACGAVRARGEGTGAGRGEVGTTARRTAAASRRSESGLGVCGGSAPTSPMGPRGCA